MLIEPPISKNFKRPYKTQRDMRLGYQQKHQHYKKKKKMAFVSWKHGQISNMLKTSL